MVLALTVCGLGRRAGGGGALRLRSAPPADPALRRHLRLQPALERPGEARHRAARAGCTASPATTATASSGSASSRTRPARAGSWSAPRSRWPARRAPEGEEELALLSDAVVLALSAPRDPSGARDERGRADRFPRLAGGGPARSASECGVVSGPESRGLRATGSRVRGWGGGGGRDPVADQPAPRTAPADRDPNSPRGAHRGMSARSPVPLQKGGRQSDSRTPGENGPPTGRIHLSNPRPRRHSRAFLHMSLEWSIARTACRCRYVPV